METNEKKSKVISEFFDKIQGKGRGKSYPHAEASNMSSSSTFDGAQRTRQPLSHKAKKSASFNAGSGPYMKTKTQSKFEKLNFRKSLLRSKTSMYIPKSETDRSDKPATVTFSRDKNTNDAEKLANIDPESTVLKRKKDRQKSGSVKRRKSGSFRVTASTENGDVDEDDVADGPDVSGMVDSTTAAKHAFVKLIDPVKPAKFFREMWERKPLLIKRHDSSRNSEWFSTDVLDRILREERVMFGENIDVVTYSEGQRLTHNPPGRAYAPVVWDYYNNGCSVRLLNPQTYCDAVWHKLALLQEFFGCCAGANVYLTPAGSQGFAPHYDDIEAFVLQLEGKKHWKLYNPRTKDEELPRFSSADFTPSDLGPPILDTVIEAGDLLYFPRGVIHQALTLPDTHSLHMTVSCYQRNTWADLLLKLMPQALQLTIDSHCELRTGLPLHYLDHTGVANCDTTSRARSAFLQTAREMVELVMSNLPLDSTCDEMSVGYIHDCLPPVISQFEKERSVHGCGERWDSAGQRVVGKVELDTGTHIRLIRKGVVRLVSGEDNVRIYHSLDNARVYHGHKEPKYIEITHEVTPAVEFLLHQYPRFVTIDDLPLDSNDLKNEVVSTLYDNGLIITRDVLTTDDTDQAMRGDT